MSNLTGKILSHYYLLEQIGLGGMASVFIALDLQTDQKVAVKVLSPHLAQTPQFKIRFRREIELLRTLRHPHIVPILDFGEEEGFAYIVMPYFAHGTLADRMKKGPLTPREGARVMDQLASALQFAHDHGVVHRDVKPSNVLLDQQGNAFLSDFGFARVEDKTLSLTGAALVGTPAYMSPEQGKGEKIDPRSDQYSLGVILFQMTTGQLPFDADTPMGLVMKHVNMPLPPPRQISPNIPEAVEAVLIKALAKDPAHRFRSVAEMNRVFQRALADAIDASGRLVHRPIPADLKKTLHVPVSQATLQAPATKKRASRLPLAAAALLLLVICPATAWAVLAENGPVSLLTNGDSATLASGPDLAATNDFLSTQIAGLPGAVLDPQEIAMAVAGTMTALAPPPPAGSESLPPPPSEEPGLTASGPAFRARTLILPPVSFTPISGAQPVPGSSPTQTFPPTNAPTSTAGPTPTPSHTSPATNTPVPSATPAPSNTPTAPPPPTNTSPPTATRTPSPPPSATPTVKKCLGPNHPVFPCTLTPTPG